MLSVAFALLQVTGTAPEPSAFQRALVWVTSSAAAAALFLINVVSLLLAAAGFYLYFKQKREYQLIFAMFQEYNLKEKIAADAKDAEQAKTRAEQQLKATRHAIESAQADLVERIPNEARKAYYENTIPVLQKQIFDLSRQLEQMGEAYSSLGGSSATISPEIERVLTEEVRRHVSLRRDMERSEGFLAILTGTTASIGTVAKYPFDLLALPFAILALREAYRFLKLWRRYYRTKPLARGAKPA